MSTVKKAENRKYAKWFHLWFSFHCTELEWVDLLLELEKNKLIHVLLFSLFVINCDQFISLLFLQQFSNHSAIYMFICGFSTAPVLIPIWYLPSDILLRWLLLPRPSGSEVDYFLGPQHPCTCPACTAEWLLVSSFFSWAFSNHIEPPFFFFFSFWIKHHSWQLCHSLWQ